MTLHWVVEFRNYRWFAVAYSEWGRVEVRSKPFESHEAAQRYCKWRNVQRHL